VAQFRKQPKTLQFLAVTLLLGVIALFIAFIFGDTKVVAFIGIGVAAAIAPILGLMLPLWAMETDVNDHPDIPKGPAHH